MTWRLAPVGAPAIPEKAQEGGEKIWRGLQNWSQAVRKRNCDQRPQGGGRGRASSLEGRGEVEVQRAYGLSWKYRRRPGPRPLSGMAQRGVTS